MGWLAKIHKAIKPPVTTYDNCVPLFFVFTYDNCVSQEELREHVTNVSCTSVATGILGLMGNKGGVGISLRSGHDMN